MGRKIEIEELKSYFEEHNCTLLEDEFINAKTKMEYICHCGRNSSITWSDFKSGRRCRKCASDKLKKERMIPSSDVKHLFDNEDYELLGHEKNEKGRTVYNFICPKGHKGSVFLYQFKNGTRCKKCRIQESSNRQRYSIDEVNELIADQGCKVIGEYVNFDTKVKYICSCGNESEGYVSAIRKGIKCGCQRKSGKESPNWRHDLTSEERQVMRNYPEYRLWVESVFHRDDYTCQCCFLRGGKLHAHHIENYSSVPDKRTDINNGIALCDLCHKDFHNIYGYRNNDADQLQEYINEIHKELAI